MVFAKLNVLVEGTLTGGEVMERLEVGMVIIGELEAAAELEEAEEAEALEALEADELEARELEALLEAAELALEDEAREDEAELETEELGARPPTIPRMKSVALAAAGEETAGLLPAEEAGVAPAEEAPVEAPPEAPVEAPAEEPAEEPAGAPVEAPAPVEAAEEPDAREVAAEDPAEDPAAVVLAGTDAPGGAVLTATTGREDCERVTLACWMATWLAGMAIAIGTGSKVPV